MRELINGRYRARIGRSPGDLRSAQSLRHMAFMGAEGLDQDSFDEICTHVLIEEINAERLVCCFRVLLLPDGESVDQSYSAQSYGLSALHRFGAPMVEMGRFCITPGLNDPDILRMAWGALARYVDENAVEMLFGCSSFAGSNADRYPDAFALLKAHHLAPSRWRPGIKAQSVIEFARMPSPPEPNRERALLQMPSLLRMYLSLGGWVSDHAVVDRQLNTLHVFTGLEIAAIPDARKRQLRAIAQ